MRSLLAFGWCDRNSLSSGASSSAGGALVRRQGSTRVTVATVPRFYGDAPPQRSFAPSVSTLLCALTGQKRWVLLVDHQRLHVVAPELRSAGEEAELDHEGEPAHLAAELF